VSQLHDVVDVLVKALVDQPANVRVVETEHRGTTLVEVFASPGEVGKLIGRQGRTIAALRTIVAATADRHGKRATLEVRDRPQG
jgi:predicted RNA-binding protein YlqC (UPF0109 family)